MTQNIYGYQDDSVKTGNGLQFGLNAGNIRMVKFEWINDAGKDGTEGEALDIQFLAEGADRPMSYRRFPLTKAFGDNGVEITDPEHPAFRKAVVDYNAILTHIMHCFVDKDVLQNALSTQISSFKEFCKILMSLLPKDYEKKPLDMFCQWQWQLTGENTRTYLDLPKKMSYGRWLSPAIPPVGKWTEKRVENPDNSKPVALWYVDDDGNTHPFKRNGWFMNSNFATQQVTEIPEEESAGDAAAEAGEDWGTDKAATSEGAANEGNWDELGDKGQS